MKPIEYIRKYNLKETDKFDHSAFVNDLTQDFISQIEFHQQTNWNFTKFKHIVKEINQKYVSISNKSYGTGFPDKLWGYFYASVICKIRDEMFSELMEARKQKKEKEAKIRGEEREERRKFEESFKNRDNDFYNSFFGNHFIGFLKWMSGQGKPVSEFQILGVDENSTVDGINRAFRSQAMKHHPDKGGSPESFRKIVEAKNKCLAYANRNVTENKSKETA